MENKTDSRKIIGILSSDGATLAKVIATFGVVLTHSYKLFKYNNIGENDVFFLRGFHAFASCGVPVFFLLSGYFMVFKDNWNYSNNLKKKVRSLVIPYCLFMLFYTLLSCVGALAVPKFFDDFREFSAYDWLMHLFGIPFIEGPSFYGPLWFVRDLMILNLLAFVLVPAVKKIPDFILIPVMIVIYFLPISQFLRYSIPFFVIGMSFGFKKRHAILINPLLLALLLSAGFFIPVIISGDYSWKVAVLLMTFAVVSVAGILIEKKYFVELAHRFIPYSFPIYLLHEYPMTALMRLLAIKHISSSLSIVAFFVAPFIIITLCILVIKLWKHFSPKSFALFTGGRY